MPKKQKKVGNYIQIIKNGLNKIARCIWIPKKVFSMNIKIYISMPKNFITMRRNKLPNENAEK